MCLGRSNRNATELRNPRGTSLSEVYHNDPHPEPGLVDDGDGVVEGVDAALGVLEGGLEKEEAVVVAVDRPEGGARGLESGLGLPGQRHMDDFLDEYVAAPVMQKPCLCVERERGETERRAKKGGTWGNGADAEAGTGLG